MALPPADLLSANVTPMRSHQVRVSYQEFKNPKATFHFRQLSLAPCKHRVHLT
jgi:hypothetical protein